MAATHRLPKIWRHPGTGGLYYRRHMPAHLRHLLGHEARRSLHTKDPSQARQRFAAMAAQVQAEIDRAQSEFDARKELDRQAAEMDAQVDQEEAFLASLTASQRDLWYRTAWAKAHGQTVLVTPQEALDAYLIGDTYETPPEEHQVPRVVTSGSVTLASLIASWSAERRPDDRTVYSWGRKLGLFETWLGHDDATRVTKADVLRYRDHLLNTKAPKTVSDTITMIRVLYQAAIESDRLSGENPAGTVKVKAKANQLEKVRPYSDEEARLVLDAARGQTSPSLRWLPILLAWTGARLEEAAGLRVCDVKQDNGNGWFIDLVPHYRRPLKTDSSQRRIPLARAVELEGFLEFVKVRCEDPGHLLFADVTTDYHGRLGANVGRRLANMVRSAGVTDPRVQPAHGFRHRFTDLMREAGVEAVVQDAILGHTTAGLTGRYGSGHSLAVLRKAIEAVENNQHTRAE
jgi:integrase